MPLLKCETCNQPILNNQGYYTDPVRHMFPCLVLTEKQKVDNINHPKHYKKSPSGIECIEVIRHLICDRANAIKYIWRAGEKQYDGMTQLESEIYDLHKAIWYLKDEIVRIGGKV